MKLNRWIFIPFLFALYFGFWFAFFNRNSFPSGFLFGFTVGALGGFILQAVNEVRIRKFSRNKAQADFSIRQKRDFTVLFNYRTAFELCVYSILSLETASIEFEDRETGIIEARTKFNLYSNGINITFQIQPISENLTEIKISAGPRFKTQILNFGESLKVIEEISRILTEKHTEIKGKHLADKAGTSGEFHLRYITKKETDYE